MAPLNTTTPLNTTNLLHLLARSYYDTGAIVNNPPPSAASYYGPDSIVNNGAPPLGYTNPPSSSSTPCGPFGLAYPMNSSHHVNGGAIAGGVIGGIVGLAALALVLRMLAKKRKGMVADHGVVPGGGRGEGKDMAQVMGKFRERFLIKKSGGQQKDVEKGMGMGMGRGGPESG
ncbi:MAG: hypothetical protein Q9169_005417 [Polycauliona sp. 2 TL-2023]